VQDVESEERGTRHISAPDSQGEVVEVRDAAIVWSGDLAIEHQSAAVPGQIGEHRAEVPAALEAVPRQQPDATVAVGDDGEPMTVMLDLK
jgi:hypothetical protein